MQLEDEDYYYIIGVVLRYHGKVIGIYGPLFWVRGSLFLKCDGEPEYEDGYPILDNVKHCKTDV